MIKSAENKIEVVDYCDENTWYLAERPPSKIVWKERVKVPQWYIDFLNGKKTIFKIGVKDWRFMRGTFTT